MPPLVLTLARGELRFTPQTGCAARVEMVPGAALDATSDGDRIQISGKMVEFTLDDNELAFVVAHELAHDDVAAAQRRAGAGVRAAELAADRAAVEMMGRAGYRTDGLIWFMGRRASARPWAWLDGAHPKWKARWLSLAEAIERVSTSPKPSERGQ